MKSNKMFNIKSSKAHKRWSDFVVFRFFTNIYYKIENFFCKVKRSFDYAVFGWNNADFDFIYILEHLQFKLKRVREHIVGHAIIEKSDEYGEEIRKAEVLLQKLIDDDFCEKLYDVHYEKWGESMFKIINGSSQLTNKNVKNKEDSEKQRAEYRIILEQEEMERNRCYDETFNYIKEKIRGWWD